MPNAGEIADFLMADVVPLVSGWRDVAITTPSPIKETGSSSLSFIKSVGSLPQDALDGPALLIAPEDAGMDTDMLAARGIACVVRVANPRLAFARAVNRFFLEPARAEIHPTAVISPDAIIGEDVSVGAYAVIGACVIGDGCDIQAGVRVYDGVRMGRDVRVFANAVIGAEGFGYERGEDGLPVKFPQMAAVIIEDEVEIGAGTCVDRGALSDTRICRGAKIDNMVHVAHNVVVGEGALVAANAVIAGSTTLGPRVWVGPSACISNGLHIGADASVSLGAVVTRDVSAGTRVTGNFAVEHSTFLRNLKKGVG